MTTSNDNILAALKTLRQEGVDTTALQYQLDEELYYSELAMHRPHPDYVLPDACYTGVEYAEGSLENPRGCPWNIRLMRIGRQFSLTKGVAEVLRGYVHEQVFPEVTIIDMEFKFGHLYALRLNFHSASVHHKLWIRDIQMFMARANRLQGEYDQAAAEREAANLLKPKKAKKAKGTVSMAALLDFGI